VALRSPDSRSSHRINTEFAAKQQVDMERAKNEMEEHLLTTCPFATKAGCLMPLQESSPGAIPLTLSGPFLAWSLIGKCVETGPAQGAGPKHRTQPCCDRRRATWKQLNFDESSACRRVGNCLYCCRQPSHPPNTMIHRPTKTSFSMKTALEGERARTSGFPSLSLVRNI
jgi:hypothetical protein